MATYEFDGISTEQFNAQDREQNFVELYDGTLIEKAPFTVELDSKEVNLHLFIEDVDMAEFEDSTDHVITIGVVPEFDALTEKNQESVLYQFDKEDIERIKQDKTLLLHESLCYGFGIPLHTVTVKEPKDVEHTINSAIAVRHAVSGLIGFELDRRRNMIGNTGWDFLQDYCEGNIDLITSALNKCKV